MNFETTTVCPPLLKLQFKVGHVILNFVTKTIYSIQSKLTDWTAAHIINSQFIRGK